MSVVTGALGSLAPKLLQLLHDEYKLQKGVKKKIQWLSDELESIYAFLSKVADVPWDRLDEQVKVWARQVREASYDMEDVLDTFLVRIEAGNPASPSNLKSAMKKMSKVFLRAKARRDISVAIEEIKKQLEEVARRRFSYKVDDIVSKNVATTSTIDPRLTAMYKGASQLIGVDKPRDEIISMLVACQPDENASHNNTTKKVSIVGVGGLGKTTLARVVYENLKSWYDCGAFITVGREHDLVKVFKDILFNLDKSKYQNIHNDGRCASLLITELREFLKNKRYFIVVDDVWEVTTWEIIESALENNFESRVITTTRKFDVANKAGMVYKLKPLSYDNSKKLFYTRIFGEDRKYLDKPTDEVSKKILNKCGGIPLAIVTITSLLVDKPNIEWSEVYNSIGFGPNKDNRDVLEDIMMVLSFSYYDLPSHLRTCLLYLCTYPENYFIDKDTLIWKWIAEGFVHGKQETRLFELGERYFNDLINRSMIQPVEDNWDGKILGCCVHDIVLDLIRKFSSEENCISLLDDNVGRQSSLSNVRWLAHQNRTHEHINYEANIVGMTKVRSYTAFRCYINNWVKVSSFVLLRVLDIVECRFKEGCHLEYLGNLVHLRYLRLRSHDIPELPKQIGDLKLLQTLDVYGRSIVLPASIVLLTQLVCLRAQMNVPNCIGKLTSLEELRIRCSSDIPQKFVKELGSLRELRFLEFYIHGMDESTQRAFVESLRNLPKIQRLKVLPATITNVDTTIWEAAGFVLPRPLCYLSWPIYFSKLPSCINPSCLPHLSYLTLHVTSIDEQDLNVLARLPVLCFLALQTESTITVRNINADDDFFQKLRYFKVIHAMVQFHQSNDGSSISLHIWNGNGPMPFGSDKRNCSKVVHSAVMPNLEVLGFDVRLQALKVNNGDCGNFGLEFLPSLREVSGSIYSYGVSAVEGDKALAALRNACEVHPNHPIVNMNSITPEERDVMTSLLRRSMQRLLMMSIPH